MEFERPPAVPVPEYAVVQIAGPVETPVFLKPYVSESTWGSSLLVMFDQSFQNELIEETREGRTVQRKGIYVVKP